LTTAAANREVKDEFQARGLAEVKAHLQFDELSEQEQQAYEKHEKMLLSERGILATARIEGKEEGRAEGVVKGKAEGEQQARIAVAQKMKAKGFAPETIAEMTGLSIEEINNL